MTDKQIRLTQEMLFKVINTSVPISISFNNCVPKYKYNKQTTKMINDLQEYLVFLTKIKYKGDCLPW